MLLNIINAVETLEKQLRINYFVSILLAASYDPLPPPSIPARLQTPARTTPSGGRPWRSRLWPRENIEPRRSMTNNTNLEILRELPFFFLVDNLMAYVMDGYSFS